MKNSLSLFVLLMSLFAFAACNQPENNVSSDSDSSAVLAEGSESSADDEAAVAAAVDTLNKGILDPEKNLLDNITSEDLSYGHSGGKIQNKSEFVDDLINGPFDFQTVNTSDQTIEVSGNTAIVRHIFSAKATNAGAPADIRLGILLVWKKENGEWKLLARQAFKLP